MLLLKKKKKKEQSTTLDSHSQKLQFGSKGGLGIHQHQLGTMCTCASQT